MKSIKRLIDKYGLRVGLFIVAWFWIGNFLIPFLIVQAGAWFLAWIPLTPLDEFILIPIACWIWRKP